MKLTQFIEILNNLAASHPDADIRFCYPSRHAGRPSSKYGKATSYKTYLRIHTALDPSVVVEIDHARAENADARNGAEDGTP